MSDRKFYTVRGYQLLSQNTTDLTPSLEDYMEMIYRKITTNGYIRVNELAQELNVKPSSVSKMMSKLVSLDMLDYQKYGVIKMTEKGWEVGKYLLWRHNVVSKFFSMLSKDNPEKGFIEAERVEHLLSKETVSKLESIMDLLQDKI